MKEKILAALKTKFKNLGFGDKAFDGVADYLSKTVTEETQIETAIGGVEPLLKSFQGEIDSRVTSAVEKAKKEPKEPGDGGDPKEPKEPKDDTPAWAKTLIETNKTLTERLNKIETGNVTQTRQQILETKLKDAPAHFRKEVIDNFSYMNFQTDEDFNSFVDKKVARASEVTQELADAGLKDMTPPDSSRKPVDDSKAIADQIAAGTKQIVEQSKSN